MGIHMVKAVGTCCMYLGSVHIHVQEMCTRQSIVEHHNFCHDPLKSFSFFSNLIGLIEISYYARFHFRIHFG